MTETVKHSLEQVLRAEIRKVSPLSGGDINDVYLLETIAGQFVVKVNSASRYPGMFPAEAEGLAVLGNTGAIHVPAVIAQGEAGKTAYLILEYMEQGIPGPGFWETFGKQLAALHHNTADYFGFKNSNYIGSLPQYNAHCTNAAAFYITQRLQPQFSMAQDKGYRFNTEALYKNLETVIPEEQPALVHGDLWSGNYLVSKDGNPCLIDPAVAYAHRETDIAMMHLFGGFPPAMMRAYNETFALNEGWEERLDVWQLYYLLVHLNLFGSGYLQSVERIVRKYSGC
ncbi:fructosamine kinase family protein [Sinomicrobium weinanense]|uniref:Fructosamine kinase family protein n=1 Tax=Sinomicrobium weinanense TaxID=2842200 RepID=A0A926Q3V7_9FLAO|nr:fructosamine kinase family protein [Sinomicrobium weinanense]MBC9796180.1 fructosamine kinase family protein [Sinomicrobium weinanense]MBU3123459.1 fructosamine kinase family protein [Sinomicrobium weinanense]